MMRPFERTILWIGLIAVVIFALIINGRVSDVRSTVQEHTAQLDTPMLDAAIFPGVPAALAERWDNTTEGMNLKPENHLWLTMHITNTGQSHVGDLAAELSLLPAISAVYPFSEGSWSRPEIAEGGKDKSRVKLTFPTLSPGDAHTVFIALQPGDMDGPPYDAAAKRQWADQYRLFWKTLTITAEENTKRVQYGLASDLTATTEHTAQR